MNRLLLMVIAGVLAVAATATAAEVGDTKGPPCTNIVFGDPGYFSEVGTGTGTVTVTLTLGAPACAEATYLLDIYNFAGTQLLVNDLTPSSVAGDTVTFSYTFTSGAPADGVCLSAQTYFRGRLADRAPDSGTCTPQPNQEPPASGFN
jgi:hypothetical protein